MSTRSLTDDLLSIACASLPGEIETRIEAIVKDPELTKDEVAERARYVIGLLRLQAKTMKYWPPGGVSAREAKAMGLEAWLSEMNSRADELWKDADGFEQALIAKGVLSEPAAPRVSLRGLWKGVKVSDEDIEDAKRSLFREPK